MFSANEAVQVSINLEDGVYRLPFESAAGKTYLFKQLRDLRTLGYPVIGYTYEYETALSDIYGLVYPGKQKVFMLDRYDLYSGKYLDLISEFAQSGIVLIDCKDCEFNAGKLCRLEFSRDKIEVYR